MRNHPNHWRISKTTPSTILIFLALGSNLWAVALDGLVAHWSFDTFDESLLDSSANGNHGQGKGVEAVAGVGGGSGIAFSDSGDHVFVPASASLQVESFTFMMWVKPASEEITPIFTYCGFEQSQGPHLALNTSGYKVELPGAVHVNIREDDPVTSNYYHSPGGSVPAGKWTHLAFTYDVTSGKSVIYANGIPVAENSMPGLVPWTDTDLYLGMLPEHMKDWLNGLTYRGAMDEFIILDNAIEHNTLGQYLDGFQHPQPPPGNPNGIVAHWSFDEFGDVLVDSSGNGNHAIPKGVREARGLGGGKAIEFSQTGDHVFVPHSNSLNVQDFTFMMWIKPSSWGIVPVFTYCGQDQYQGPHMALNTNGYKRPAPGAIHVNIRETNSSANHYYPTCWGLVAAESWNHIAFSYDSESGVSQIFINGKQVAKAAFPGLDPWTSTDLYLGIIPAHTKDWLNGLSFQGVMDEFIILDHAISKPDLKRYLAGMTKSVVLYYHFDEMDDHVVEDGSGTGNHGNLTGSLVSGLHGKGARLTDGQHIRVQYSQSTRVSDFSFMAWIRPDSEEMQPVFTFKDQTQQGGPNLAIHTLDGEHTSAGSLIASLEGSLQEEAALFAKDVLQRGQWNQVCLSYSRSQARAKLYVNGNLVTVEKRQIEIASHGEVYFGHIPLDANTELRGKGYSGSLDEIRLFDFPVEDREVQRDYAFGKGMNMTVSAQAPEHSGSNGLETAPQSFISLQRYWDARGRRLPLRTE